mmetsp:Transcript_48275/g.92318  ORF Transcript_48275/g.92318 Transcript_48275/m.92318 type:complete len:204 (-) Transcript_48275:636-1247(-)
MPMSASRQRIAQSTSLHQHLVYANHCPCVLMFASKRVCANLKNLICVDCETLAFSWKLQGSQSRQRYTLHATSLPRGAGLSCKFRAPFCCIADGFGDTQGHASVFFEQPEESVPHEVADPESAEGGADAAAQAAVEKDGDRHPLEFPADMLRASSVQQPGPGRAWPLQRVLPLHDPRHKADNPWCTAVSPDWSRRVWSESKHI